MGSNKPTHGDTIFVAIIGAYMCSYEPAYRSANMGSYESADGGSFFAAYIGAYLGSNKSTN